MKKYNMNQSKNGEVRRQLLISNKAHNLILDMTLSVGVVGVLCYGGLLGFCLWRVILSPLCGMEAIAFAYLVFTLTWYDCAQFTHLAWWALSLWGEQNKPFIDRSFDLPHNQCG